MYIALLRLKKMYIALLACGLNNCVEMVFSCVTKRYLVYTPQSKYASTDYILERRKLTRTGWAHIELTSMGLSLGLGHSKL